MGMLELFLVAVGLSAFWYFIALVGGISFALF